MTQIDNILFDLCGNDFLEPYLRRQLENAQADKDSTIEPKDPIEPVAAVSIRSEAGNDPDPAFERACRERTLPVLSLYCPLIIGTGMIGLPRRIAASLYKGTYFTIKGKAGKVSAIHASDIARAVSIAAGTDGAFTITDGTETAIDDLADALSFRLGDKRIYCIKPWLARIIYGKGYYGQLTSDHLASDSFGLSYPDFNPTPVTKYLRTHVYDENSL